MSIVRTAQSPRNRVQLICDPDEKQTIVYSGNICDINNIVSRYRTTGVWPGDLRRKGRFVDQSEDLTLHDLQNIKLVYANGLPADERDAFLANPREYLSAVISEFSELENEPTSKDVGSPASADAGSPPQATDNSPT